MSKENGLNFLRLVFAYIVVVYHGVILSGAPPRSLQKYYNIFDGRLASIAVSGFFILSGFLVLKSYWSSASIKEYFVKRCKRLLPAYYLVVLICAAGLSLLSVLPPDKYFSSSGFWRYLAANILFMNFIQPSLPGVFDGGAVNGSLWTIKLEAGFYLIVPLLAFIIKKCRTGIKTNILLFVLYIAGYIYRFCCLHIYEVTRIKFINELSHQMPAFIQYFSVGMFCLLNFDMIRKYIKYLIMPGILLLVMYYVTGMDYLLPIGLGIIIMFIGFNIPCLNGIGKNGDYSYGIYIFHFPLLQVLRTLGYFELHWQFSMVMAMGLVFTSAYMSWHLLEKKVLNRSSYAADLNK